MIKKTIFTITAIFMILATIMGAKAYNGDICNDTHSPCGGGCTSTDLSGMFHGVSNFDTTIGDITGWNTSCVTNMNSLFILSDFNQPIGGWDTSNVNDMYGMFYGNTVFNGDISNWNTSSVTDMRAMFTYDSSFNQPIGGWDTSSVTSFDAYGSYGIFEGCSSFNQPLNNWNTTSVTDMSRTFLGATNFNQDIGGWDVSQVTDMTGMFTADNLSIANYDALLNGWASQTLQNGVAFNAGNSQYSPLGLSARNDTLIGTYTWAITDGGMTTAECTVDTDCGTCQYCNSGTCDNQPTGNDTKNECGICSVCDGTGSCGANDFGDTKGLCNGVVQGCFQQRNYNLGSGCSKPCPTCNPACGYSQNPVNEGNVCINTTLYNNAPTTNNHCDIWSDCIKGQTTASQYYVGYSSLGGCSANNWVATGTTYSTPNQDSISVTEKAPTCQEQFPNGEATSTGTSFIDTLVKILTGLGAVAVLFGLILGVGLIAYFTKPLWKK